MPDAIITVENLSKKYLVGHQTGDQGGDRYVALRNVRVLETRHTVRRTIEMTRGRQVQAAGSRVLSAR